MITQHRSPGVQRGHHVQHRLSAEQVGNRLPKAVVSAEKYRRIRVGRPVRLHRRHQLGRAQIGAVLLENAMKIVNTEQPHSGSVPPGQAVAGDPAEGRFLWAGKYLAQLKRAHVPDHPGQGGIHRPQGLPIKGAVRVGEGYVRRKPRLRRKVPACQRPCHSVPQRAEPGLLLHPLPEDAAGDLPAVKGVHAAKAQIKRVGGHRAQPLGNLVDLIRMAQIVQGKVQILRMLRRMLRQSPPGKIRQCLSLFGLQTNGDKQFHGGPPILSNKPLRFVPALLGGQPPSG